MRTCRAWILLPLVLACVPAAAPPPDDADHADEHEDEHEGVIELPATVRRNLGITFADVEARHVEQTLRVPGAFELRPLARREYRMSLPGRIELLVDQYDTVRVGQPLYRYQSPAWPELLHEIILGEQALETAAAEIVVASAALAETERRLEVARERLEALARADFRKAQLELEAAELEASLPRLRAELELARTRLANADRTHEHALHRAAAASQIPEHDLEAEVVVDGERVPNYSTIDWIDVRAEKGGVVEALHVTDGAFVEPPANVLSVVDPQAVRFRALALQADLPKLEGAVLTRIVPPRSPELPIDEGVEATMTIGLEAHPQERTLTLLAVPERPAAWIRPGISAFLEVVVGASAAPALAVPRSAIVQDGLTHVFFRRDPHDPDHVLRVEADLGISDGRWVVLESGVMRGDQVVDAGAYELNLAAKPAPTGGHVHADGSVHDDH